MRGWATGSLLAFSSLRGFPSCSRSSRPPWRCCCSRRTVVSGYWVFCHEGPGWRGACWPSVAHRAGLIAVTSTASCSRFGVASGGKRPAAVRWARCEWPLLEALPAGETSSRIRVGVRDHQVRGRSAGAIAAAKAAGKSVMLDFYAGRCVSCKRWKYTFSDSGVQAALGNTVLLRADVTRTTNSTEALLQHLGILGPPTIAFYDATGAEQRSLPRRRLHEGRRSTSRAAQGVRRLDVLDESIRSLSSSSLRLPPRAAASPSAP